MLTSKQKGIIASNPQKHLANVMSWGQNVEVYDYAVDCIRKKYKGRAGMVLARLGVDVDYTDADNGEPPQGARW